MGVAIDYGINRGEGIRAKNSWQIISENREEPAKIRAVMNNGCEIGGRYWLAIQNHMAKTCF